MYSSRLTFRGQGLITAIDIESCVDHTQEAWPKAALHRAIPRSSSKGWPLWDVPGVEEMDVSRKAFKVKSSAGNIDTKERVLISRDAKPFTPSTIFHPPLTSIPATV